MVSYREYASLASRTLQVDESVREVYLIAGFIGELGELLNLLKKELRGDVIGRDLYTDEMGDVLWYFSQLLLLPGYDKPEPEALLDVFGKIENGVSKRFVPEVAISELIHALDTANRLYFLHNYRGDVNSRRTHLTWMKTYIHHVAFFVQVDLQEAATRNIDKLQKRQANNTIQGHRRDE